MTRIELLALLAAVVGAQGVERTVRGDIEMAQEYLDEAAAFLDAVRAGK